MYVGAAPCTSSLYGVQFLQTLLEVRLHICEIVSHPHSLGCTHAVCLLKAEQVVWGSMYAAGQGPSLICD